MKNNLLSHCTLSLVIGALSGHVFAGDLPNGRYTIHPVHSGKCVDVAWASKNDGANIAQVACNGNTAQVFDVADMGGGWYRMININSGKAIDVSGGSTADNANIQQWGDNGTGAQRFSAVRASGNQFRLVNKNSGKCMDVNGGSTSDGANILQYSCHGNTNQLFTFTTVGSTGTTATGSSMQPGQALKPGGSLSSPNGAYKFIYQTDGNLVLYAGSRALWASGTYGRPVGSTDMQADGNLVIYTDSHQPIWASNTWGQNGNVLKVQDDGNVVLYNTSGRAVWATNTVQTTNPGTGNNGSINSISAASIPNPPANGSLTVKVMNGTKGRWADNQVYWGVLGLNPVTGSWSYLDLQGNLEPISSGLNNAPGHLTKDGVNYANIYHKVSDASWFNLPKITSGRMFLCVGSPCYIKTYDDGFAGPNIDNPTDPNRNIYFDFIEFTIDNSGYHGNTTRVDAFGFPVQMRLVNKAGNYDRTVGEPEAETRDGIFAAYTREVPNEFKALGQIQSPYRIVAPIHGSFAPGGANQDYFTGYAPFSTRDILLGENYLAQNPQVDAAINRHVYNDSANWNNPAAYYKGAPANYYAKFWHDHGIDRLAYGFPYDDVNGQASYLEIDSPKGLLVRVGW